ncbi:MAG: ABC transporter ATP-binding protein, partial [Ruminiclostridium sp.]
MQTELRKIQQALELTFVYVTHDQEEALTMSDTVVVMNGGLIQQIGSPTDIYNEPVNAFVADFIGESNIINGCMPEDCVVEFTGKRFTCVDKGFSPNETVDVVIRPEDIKIIPAENAKITGIVESVVFKGVHYEMIVDGVDHKWMIHSTKYEPVGTMIGMAFDPDDIHIMKKSADSE